MTTIKYEPKPKWPLEGNFFRYVLQDAQGVRMGKQLADDGRTGISEGIITNVSNGTEDFRKHASKFLPSMRKKELTPVEANDFDGQFLDGYVYLAEVDLKAARPFARPIPQLALQFLSDVRFIDDTFAQTTLFRNWAANRNEFLAKKRDGGASREIRAVGDSELNISSANLTGESLKVRGFSDTQRPSTDALHDWRSRRKTLQANEKEGDEDKPRAENLHFVEHSSLSETSSAIAKGTSAQGIDGQHDAQSRSKQRSRRREPHLNEQPKTSTVGTSLQPVNHVEKICYMRPIEVLQRDDGTLHIILDVNLGEERKEFEDLIVTAGFEKLRIKVNLEGFEDVRSLHRNGKLRGRIAFQNGDEVFVVEETYFGKPAPFLKDTVFEDEALYSAKLAKREDATSVGVKCFIAFSDFELDVFDNDGERLESFTDRQRNLRKLALKEFIKTRCKTRGFEGTVSEADWVGDVEA